MACQRVLLLAVLAAACLASVASGMNWMVGDADGWRPQFDKTNWADGKTFRVGDTLAFMYPKENHTVAQVDNKDDFAACNLKANSLKSWDTGKDVISLDKAGKMWFFCTKPNHCLNGMKLVINVLEAGAAPAPAPEAPAPSSAPVVSYTVGGAVAVAGAIVASVLAF